MSACSQGVPPLSPSSMPSSSPEDMQTIIAAAQALKMTPQQFLRSEVLAVRPDEARGYLKAFAAHASAVQIKLLYYVTKTLAEA